MSLDAIFGLKRWKKAKDSTTKPKHGTRVFEDQDVVDEYIKGYKTKGKIRSDLQVSKFVYIVLLSESDR